MKNNYTKRIIVYFFGLFIMTIGVSLSVKSNLGVSPVSSIPYTMTCVWGIEMGKATIIFHCILVLFQIILLRKKFKIKNLLQVIIGVIFGYFTTFSNWAVSYIILPDNMILRVILVLVSTVFVAFGIFFYMPANIMPLAGEGVMDAVSNVSGVPFSKVKIGFDISMVVISLSVCLYFIKGFGSVGAGTIIAAILVGTVLGIITKLFGEKRDEFLQMNEDTTSVENAKSDKFVITIAREYGSGGREIGRRVAKELGLEYYDLDIIRKASRESSVEETDIIKNEQNVKNVAALLLYHWCVCPSSESELPMAEKIYHMQKKIIKEYANNQSCVIVGRLSNFILKDYRGIKIFIGASMDSKVERVMARENIGESEAKKKIVKVESERENHCLYFTHKNWRNCDNYDFYIKSDIFGIEETTKMVVNLAKEKMKQ